MSIEDKYAESIAIMFPVVVPSNHTMPVDPEINSHCTVTYLGEIPDVNYNPSDIIRMLKDLPNVNAKEISTEHFELFGVENDFLVLLLDASPLREIQAQVLSILRENGIESADRYPDYRPHITIREGYVGGLESLNDVLLPPTVTLGIPMLWWGNERYNIV